MTPISSKIHSTFGVKVLSNWSELGPFFLLHIWSQIYSLKITVQNTVLLVGAIDWNLTYKDLMKFMVCNIGNKECMFHRCENCPSADSL